MYACFHWRGWGKLGVGGGGEGNSLRANARSVPYGDATELDVILDTSRSAIISFNDSSMGWISSKKHDKADVFERKKTVT